MAKLFYGSIDVNKIDKSKLVKGEKGTYLNLSVWLNDQPDQFGNVVSIQQSLTKEEREAGAEKIYLGNLKESGFQGGNNAAPQQSAAPAQADDDLPF